MKKKKKTLLWTINGRDIPGPSYLFGTMHVKDQRAFAYKDQVLEKIANCDAFASEFNLAEAGQNATGDMMDLSEGQSLDQLLPPKYYQKIDKRLQKLTGLSLDYFNSSRPILITNLLSERMLSQDMSVSLDEYLWNYAQSQEKVSLGIETLAEQIQILHQIPLDYQVKSLIWAAKNFKRFRRQTLKMTKLYEEGDINKLYKAGKKSLKGIRKLLLFDRNKVMAERIARLVDEQRIFIAIGAGHLGGKKGVIRLLKKAGYTLRPVQKTPLQSPKD